MFNKLLKDYRQSQRSVICEFSGNMDRDFALLEDDVKKIKTVIEKHDVKEIVYGIPKDLYGGIGLQGEKTLKFVEHLKKYIDIQMNPWDERFTTKEAERILIEEGIRREKRKQMRDRLSAVLILQGYLDSKKCIV